MLIYLIVPFWYTSAVYPGCLAEPWFVFWRGSRDKIPMADGETKRVLTPASSSLVLAAGKFFALLFSDRKQQLNLKLRGFRFIVKNLFSKFSVCRTVTLLYLKVTMMS